MLVLCACISLLAVWSPCPQVAVQSLGVLADALHTLAAVTEAVELDVNQVGKFSPV